MNYKRTFLLIVLLLLQTPGAVFADTPHQSVFDRARAVVEYTRSGRKDPKKVLPVAKEKGSNHFGFSQTPRAQYKRMENTNRAPVQDFVSAKPLGECRFKKRRIEMSRAVPSAFNGADYIFYDTKNRAQSSRAAHNRSRAVAYGGPRSQAGDNPFIDLRQELTRYVKIRCLPTRVRIRRDKSKSTIEYTEGDSAWIRGAVTHPKRR